MDSKTTINDTKVDDTFNDYEYHQQIPMPQIWHITSYKAILRHQKG